MDDHRRRSTFRWIMIAMLACAPALLLWYANLQLQQHHPQHARRQHLQATAQDQSTPVNTRGLEQALDYVRRSEYYFSADDQGAWTAPNRAQDLRITANTDGLHLTARTRDAHPWRATMRLSQWGRAGLLTDAEAVIPKAHENRVGYERAGLTEWYVNDQRGLEQGFTIAERPASGPTYAPVVLELTYSKELMANPTQDALTIVFSAADAAPVLRYAGLRAWDAEERPVRCQLVMHDDARFQIQVDDRHATYPITIDPVLTTPDWIAEGDLAQLSFARSVSSAGDVNGDGYDDVIIGAPYYDGLGGNSSGRAFVFLGSASGLGSVPAWTADGLQAGAQFGEDVGRAGDVNRDGYSDIIIGADMYDNGNTAEGMAFVWHGGDPAVVTAVCSPSATPSGLGPCGVPANATWRAEGDMTFARLGDAVNPAGDVNNDGYDDIIIGAEDYSRIASSEGAAFVWYGGPGGLGPDGTPANADWRAFGDQAGASFGEDVDTAGDINNDGFSDVIIGADKYDNGHTDEGAVFVWLGSAAGLLPNDSTPADAFWRAESDQRNANMGQAVSNAGDVNGDSFDDIIVGAPYYTNGNANEGAAFVWLGSGTGLGPDGTPANAFWRAEADQSNASFGDAVDTAGDVDCDGYSDIIVGAPEYRSSFDDEGAAFYWMGSAMGLGPPGTPMNADGQDMGGQPGALFGEDVATAGDVDGNRASDVIIGSPYYDNGQTDEGQAFAYYGECRVLLSVTWDFVRAVCVENDGILVEWQTLLEEGTVGYAVEHALSAAGPFTTKSPFIPAHGALDPYAWLDASPALDAHNYYRIREYTYAGLGDVSPVVTTTRVCGQEPTVYCEGYGGLECPEGYACVCPEPPRRGVTSDALCVCEPLYP